MLNEISCVCPREKQKNALTEQINIIANQIKELEEEKDKSVSMFKYWIFTILECIFIISAIIFFFLLLISYVKDVSLSLSEYLKNNLGLLFGFCLSAFGIIGRMRSMFVFSPKIQYDNIRKEQERYWIDKNPKYNDLKEEFSKLQTERRELNI